MGCPIRLSDSSDHGGEVISASETYLIDGRGVARRGDLVRCPRCDGVFRILTGAEGFLVDGAPLAREGDVTECGARLLASARQFGVF